ncbi:hypothetical protein AQJ43_06810 [Streptomyces avermitilis]|uniref:Uncharacterized protein n=1 Tax=Streptomyces avermitilis TaxID=33903 RepID=A0A4D4LQQ6_STRAX|nr:hypothetical protein [Streptomyces avermitilis]KUN55790.1 hypothetical protein AQJ43_06810 [Streptomyces avermitilis]OOV25636.1 hypothetical protein SM007_25030 [Streptomyces avermitilis]GDY61696.1 hypothetical protein SAV14893_010890 [Streptomyces avermitilis]GDY87062.1 hypothetical protein SAVCW2_62610 [Streptomyces avermitilis]
MPSAPIDGGADAYSTDRPDTAPAHPRAGTDGPAARPGAGPRARPRARSRATGTAGATGPRSRTAGGFVGRGGSEFGEPPMKPASVPAQASG